jgi:hypothetical protein
MFGRLHILNYFQVMILVGNVGPKMTMWRGVIWPRDSLLLGGRGRGPREPREREREREREIEREREQQELK